MNWFLAVISNCSYDSVQLDYFESEENAQEWLIDNEFDGCYSVIIPFETIQQRTALTLEARMNTKIFFQQHQTVKEYDLEFSEF